MKSQILKKKLDLNKMTISNLRSSEMKEIKGGAGRSWAAMQTYGTWEYECWIASCRQCPI